METVPKDKYTPLKGYIIYFDLKCIPQKNLLYELLRRLGGTIEEFLSKDINCIITDKNLKKINRGSHGDQPSSASTPSPHGSSIIHLGRISSLPLRETLLSHNKRIQTTLFRGKNLVDRANKTQQKGTTDVLEFSKQWGIHIVNLHSVLEWLEKLRKKKLINIKDKRKLSERNGYSSTTSDIIRFHGPYIKVEDINNNYRPQNKNLGQWPELNLISLRGSCPFPALKPSGLNKKLTSDFIIRRNKTTENSKFNLKILSKIQQRKTQLSTSGYCEICCCHFTNQQKHVTTENHKDVLLNSESFNNLRKELAELFSTQKFLSKVESSTEFSQFPLKEGNSTKLVCDSPENISKIPQVNEISFGKNEKHKMISSTLTYCQSQDTENWETSINFKKMSELKDRNITRCSAKMNKTDSNWRKSKFLKDSQKFKVKHFLNEKNFVLPGQQLKCEVSSNYTIDTSHTLKKLKMCSKEDMNSDKWLDNDQKVYSEGDKDFVKHEIIYPSCETSDLCWPFFENFLEKSCTRNCPTHLNISTDIKEQCFTMFPINDFYKSKPCCNDWNIDTKKCIHCTGAKSYQLSKQQDYPLNFEKCLGDDNNRLGLLMRGQSKENVRKKLEFLPESLPVSSGSVTVQEKPQFTAMELEHDSTLETKPFIEEPLLTVMNTENYNKASKSSFVSLNKDKITCSIVENYFYSNPCDTNKFGVEQTNISFVEDPYALIPHAASLCSDFPNDKPKANYSFISSAESSFCRDNLQKKLKNCESQSICLSSEEVITKQLKQSTKFPHLSIRQSALLTDVVPNPRTVVQVLTHSSMMQIMDSEGDKDFSDFSAEEVKLPSGLSYTEVSITASEDEPISNISHENSHFFNFPEVSLHPGSENSTEWEQCLDEFFDQCLLEKVSPCTGSKVGFHAQNTSLAPFKPSNYSCVTTAPVLPGSKTSKDFSEERTRI